MVCYSRSLLEQASTEIRELNRQIDSNTTKDPGDPKGLTESRSCTNIGIIGIE